MTFGTWRFRGSAEVRQVQRDLEVGGKEGESQGHNCRCLCQGLVEAGQAGQCEGPMCLVQESLDPFPQPALMADLVRLCESYRFMAKNMASGATLPEL